MADGTASWLVVGLLVGLIAVALVSLRKLRAVHVATCKLVDDASSTRREVEALFGQIQALHALERELALPHPLPPVRGWAGSPDFLLATHAEIRRRRPRVVVECSSGVSTVVIARTLQLLGGGHVYSLEHDAEYAHKTGELLDRFGLRDWASVLHAPLQATHTPTPWYREEALPDAASPIDMLVVDGPPESTGPLAREPAFARLRSRMSASFAILVDDADRPDENEMVRRWLAVEPSLRTRSVPAEKGLVVVEFG